MSTQLNVLKIIKNAEIYAPESIGIKDVLLTADKIGMIEKNIPLDKSFSAEIIDAGGKKLVPGFIDSHVHILGGGGEGSFRTRTPEIMLSDIIRGGVTTIVGCLGTDGISRSMNNLIAKANGLREEGISCYTYTGSYQVPVRTLTGSIEEDIIFIDSVIGVGEIAMSDHRSSQPSVDELAKIAASARVAGMLSGKAGIVNIHLGDGDRKLSYIKDIVKNTEIPITQFLPTHAGRNESLFEASIAFAKSGGLIDLTTSTKRDFKKTKELSCADLLAAALGQGVPIENISFSSDGQGSLPEFDENGKFLRLGVGQITTLWNEVREAVQNDIPLEEALKVITSNVSRNLKLPAKGRIETGNDADLVLLDSDLQIDTVVARGQIMIRDKNILVKGTFEK